MDNLPIDLEIKTANLTNFLISYFEKVLEIKPKHTEETSNKKILASIEIRVQAVEFLINLIN